MLSDDNYTWVFGEKKNWMGDYNVYEASMSDSIVYLRANGQCAVPANLINAFNGTVE